MSVIRPLILAIGLLGASAQVFAANVSMNESLDCFRGPFQSYEQWASLLEKNKKKFNRKMFEKRFPKEKFDDARASLVCRDFTYDVDGITVAGFYVMPKSAQGKKLPVVVYNRGGNAGFGAVKFATKINFLGELANEGYLVIGSQYRGASRFIKNNGQDEFGGADVNDVIAITELAKTIPEANTDKMAMIGWSRGVMQTYRAATHLPGLSAIVAIAGNSDIEKALAWRPAMEKVYNKRVPDFKKNRQQEMEKRSVIKWLDKLPEAPILLVHGDKDKRVNVEQSQAFAETLKADNRTHKLVVYPDNHGLIKHRPQLINEINAWLKRYL